MLQYRAAQPPGVVFDQTTESLRDLPEDSSVGPTLSKIEPLRIDGPSGLLVKSFGVMAGGAGKEILLMVLLSSEETWLACFACCRRRIELTTPTDLIIIDQGGHELQVSGPGQEPGLTE